MKKEVCLAFIFLISISFISSIEVEMKSSYDQGETLIAKLSGAFLSSVEKENVFFYRNYVQVPLDYNIVKVNEDYYIYSIVPETPNNYSLVVKNVYYRQGTRILDNETRQNFSISDKPANFNINPGALITKENFSIKVQNLQSSKITISASAQNLSGSNDSSLFTFSNVKQELDLKSGEIKTINFKIDNLKNSTFRTITLSSANTKYEIPVSIIVNDTKIEEKVNFKFSPVHLNFTSATNTNKTKIIFLNNTGNVKIEDITLSVSDSLKEILSLSTYNIEKLEPGSDIRMEVFFFSDEEGIFEGQIKAKTNNLEITNIPVYSRFIKDYVLPAGENETDEHIPTNGKDNENTPSNFYSTGKIIGWSLIAVILIVLYWFYTKKFKGAKKSINLLKIGKGKD